MSSQKIILLSLILPGFLLVFIIPGMFKNGHFDSDDFTFWLFFICIVWGLTLIAGRAITKIIKTQTRQSYIYLFSQLLVILLIVGAIATTKFKDFIHERNFANIENNHSFVSLRGNTRLDTSAGTIPIQRAFIKLESTFKDPNSFILLKSTDHTKDTLIDTKHDSVHIIYFTYLIDSTQYFSKIRVLGNAVDIDILNANPATSPEYHEVNRQFEERKKESLQMIKEALKIVRDSVSRQMMDTAIKIFKK